MTALKGLGNGLLAAFVIAVCCYSRTDASPAGTANPEVMVLTPGEKYVLDFSDFPDRGVPAGNFNNFAFSLALRQPLQKITVQDAQQHKNVIATDDFAACSKGQESLLEKPLNELTRGTPAWVDYVDIEMIPFPQRELKWTGGVCYGYRKPSGTWYWKLVATPLIYDPASDRVRGRIWVKEADIDALKLVFDESVPRQLVRSVTVTIQPRDAGLLDKK